MKSGVQKVKQRIVIEHKENICVACQKARILKVTDHAIYVGCDNMKTCKEKEGDQTT